MKKFNYNKIVKELTVVHCETEEQVNELLTWADSVGLKWSTERSYLGYNNYNDYKEDTCYYLYEGEFSFLYYYKKENYTIISFDEALMGSSKPVKFKNQKEFIIHKLLIDKSITRNFAIKNYITRLSSLICKLNIELSNDKALETENVPYITAWGKKGYDYRYTIKDDYYIALYSKYSYLLTDIEKDIIANKLF